MSIIGKITGGYTSTAKVTDDTLILTMPDAISPVVWRLDLADTKESAIEVQDNDGIFMLVLKTPKGNLSEIAPFETKAKAVNALMCISKALEQNQKAAAVQAYSENTAPNPAPQAAPAANVAPAPIPAQSSGKGQMVAGLVGIFVLLGLLFLLFNASNPGQRIGSVAQSTSDTGFSGQQTGNETGVPVSADDFLRTR